MKKHPVLFVDDEPILVRTFINNFEDSFQLLTAGSGPEALEILRAKDVAVMVTDQRMPGMHGLELIREGLVVRSDLVPIILTGFTNDADLIEAINLQRIYRYIPKPWDPDELQHTIEGALEKYRLVADNRRLTADLKEANERLRAENAYLKAADIPRTLIGESPATRRLLDEIRRVAPKDVTVLIRGETGTGKELVARAIHAISVRRDKLFVAVNCAELSQDAAESRLFGHRKGSFTGAVDEHKGFFEVADAGTLFLDEIGELPLTLQAKLLRALQEGEITRFGDNRSRKVNVRVIAATNRDLDADVKSGAFRADLLYRLNVVPISIPPLRERREDVPVLAEHFLSVHARKMGVPVPPLTPAGRDALMRLRFFGNVRDLENLMVRALVMAEHGEPITPADIGGPEPEPTGVASATATVANGSDDGLLEMVARFERDQIIGAIQAARGNRAQAARALKISYRWLLKKLERYGNIAAHETEGR